MPVYGVHVDHVMMIWMVEIGCGMHRTVRGRHLAGVSRTCVAVARMVLRIYCTAAAAVVDTSVLDSASVAVSASATVVNIASRATALY
jgi:hypothetical protein